MVRTKVLGNPYGSGSGLYRSLPPKPSERSHERAKRLTIGRLHCHVDEGSLPAVQQSHDSGARSAPRVLQGTVADSRSRLL